MFEYLYDYIAKKSNRFLLDRLERREYLKVKSLKNIMRFVQRDSLENIIVLCSKLGLRTALMMWDEEDQKPRSVKEVMVNYLDMEYSDMQKQQIRDKVFVSMDIDFIRSVMLVGKSSNSDRYTVNRRYLQLVPRRGIKLRMLDQKLEAEQNLDWYFSVIEYALNLEPVLDAYHMSLDQFRLLLFLYRCPNGATMPLIRVKFLKPVLANRMVADLRSKNMLFYDVTNPEVVHIAAYGLVVMDQIIAKFP